MKISDAGDADKLDGAPEEFKAFVPKALQHAEGEFSGTTPSMYVKGLHTDGYALGGFSASDGGVAAMWAAKDGTWKQIWSGQNVPDCAPLREVRFPAALLAFSGSNECMDGGSTVRYGSNQGSSSRPKATPSTKSTTAASGRCDVPESVVSAGLNKSSVKITSLTCSKQDPNWAKAMVDAPYGSSSSDIRTAVAYLHRSGGSWTYVAGGFHGGSWCKATKDAGFPSDFKSDSGC